MGKKKSSGGKAKKAAEEFPEEGFEEHGNGELVDEDGLEVGWENEVFSAPDLVEDDEYEFADEGDEGEEKAFAPETCSVTSALIEKTLKKALNGNYSSSKKLFGIFKSVCVPAADQSDEESFTVKYVVSSPELYNEIVSQVLSNGAVILYKLLGIETPSETTAEILKSHPKWKPILKLILSFFKSVMHVLSGLAASTKDIQVASYIISSMDEFLHLLAATPRLAKNFLNALLVFWANGPNITERSSRVRLSAFMLLLKMSQSIPGCMAEECFRSVYLSFARSCKSMSESTSHNVTFMMECIAMLYGTDSAMAYQQAYLYIRQLGLHLRTILLKHSTDSTVQVTGWQFVNCLRCWVTVLCESSVSAELRELVFPLTQIILGSISHVSSPYFIPYKFHLISLLHRLASKCETFIPTTMKLFEILESVDPTTKITPSTEVAPKLAYILKFPTDSLNSAVVRDAIIQHAITLVQHDAEIYKFHPGFPELSFFAIRKLRVLSKKWKVSKWRDLARSLANQLEDNISFAKKERSALPKSGRAGLDTFESLIPKDAARAAIRLEQLRKKEASYLQKISAETVEFNPHELDISSALQSKPKRKRHDDEDEEDGGEGDSEDEEDEEEDEEDEEEEEEVKKVSQKKQKQQPKKQEQKKPKKQKTENPSKTSKYAFAEASESLEDQTQPFSFSDSDSD